MYWNKLHAVVFGTTCSLIYCLMFMKASQNLVNIKGNYTTNKISEILLNLSESVKEKNNVET